MAGNVGPERAEWKHRAPYRDGPSDGANDTVSESPPVDASVRYWEPFCQFSLRSTVIALVWFVVSEWISYVAAERGLNTLLLILLMLPGTISGFYLVGIFYTMPGRIRISNGVIHLGAHMIPRAGRMWRRINVSLDDVIRWDIVAPSPTPILWTVVKSLAKLAWHGPKNMMRHRGRLEPGEKSELQSGPQPIRFRTGDLRAVGHLSYLVLLVQPAASDFDFPKIVHDSMALHYSAEMGYGSDGRAIIKTRKPRKLEKALERALPGRRGSIDLTKGPAQHAARRSISRF